MERMRHMVTRMMMMMMKTAMFYKFRSYKSRKETGGFSVIA